MKRTNIKNAPTLKYSNRRNLLEIPVREWMSKFKCIDFINGRSTGIQIMYAFKVTKNKIVQAYL